MDGLCSIVGVWLVPPAASTTPTIHALVTAAKRVPRKNFQELDMVHPFAIVIIV
jgi:hypothetical protein